MARPRRTAPGGFIYHVCNRGSRKGPLFTSPEEYTAFEEVLACGRELKPMRITAYCLMGNHWHLLLWPKGDRDLSRFLHWVQTKHASQYRRATATIGEGAVYQSRFTSVPVTNLIDYLRVRRYVERNPLKAQLVERAEDWRWSSAAQRAAADTKLPMDDGPVALPASWLQIVNQELDLSAEELIVAL
jgi:putative transposase